jgi:hypothetical protein
MNVPKIEKKLQDDTINWNEVFVMLRHVPKESIDRLLLAVIKHVDVPLDIVLLLARNSKLKTLRKAFDQTCHQELMPIIIVKSILSEMIPISTEMNELCLRTALRCNRSEVIDILIKMEGDFLSSNFAEGSFQEADDFDRLIDMILKKDLIVLRKDVFSKSHVLHQFVLKGRVDIVERIVQILPSSVQLMDENKNIPLHHALERQEFSVASTLVQTGAQIGLKFGGLLVKNRRNRTPLLCGLTSHNKEQSSSSKVQSIMNILEWLQSIGMMNDAIIVNDIIRFTLENGYDEIANNLYKDSVENNVQRIEPSIVSMLKELTKEKQFSYDSVAGFVHTNNIRNEKNWMDPVFHGCVSDGRIKTAHLLLISHPNLLQSKDEKGRLPIHRACSSICEESLSMINLLFEGAQRYDCIQMKHSGMFEPDKVGTTAFDTLFNYFQRNSVEINNIVYKVLRKMLDTDRSLPVIPYMLLQPQSNCFDVLYDHLLKDHTLRWNPLAQYHGHHALFYAIRRLIDKCDERVGPFLELCYDRTSRWHACVEAKDKEGQLPLHYALRTSTQLPSKIIFNLVASNLKSLGEPDGVSGLYPALLAAVHSDLGTIYELLRSYSQIIFLE